MDKKLRSGGMYLVTYKDNLTGKRTKAKRVFKWEETNGLGIDCLVFTSRIRGKLTAQWDESKQQLSMTGKHLPASEVAIPAYCIVDIKETT